MAEDIRNMAETKGVAAFEKQFEKPYCVIMDSEYCSMGRMIAFKACQMAGYTYYDAVSLLDLVPEAGITKDDVDAYETKLRKKELSREEIVSDPDYQKISAAFDQAVDKALAKGPCLIHDKTCVEKVRAKGRSVFTIFNYATDPDAKIVRASKSPLYKDLKDREAFLQSIAEEDHIRSNWHRAQSDTVWGEAKSYDLCINAETLGRDYSAWVLGTILKGNH